MIEFIRIYSPFPTTRKANGGIRLSDGRIGKHWTNTLGENQWPFATYLPEYTFKVKARLRNQEMGRYAHCHHHYYIYILLYGWHGMPKSFYILLILLCVFFWFRFYKRKLLLESSLELEKKKSQNEQELNNERLRFYTNITHELRTR